MKSVCQKHHPAAITITQTITQANRLFRAYAIFLNHFFCFTMKPTFVLLLLITALAFNACQSDQNASKPANKEAAAETKKPKHKIVNMMGKIPPQLFAQKLNDPNVVLVDLRTPAELKETGIIKGAVNIDYQTNNWQDQFSKFKKDQTILVYCAVGGRSGEAYTQLQQMGYSRLFDLQGGLYAWMKEGMPLEKQ